MPRFSDLSEQFPVKTKSLTLKLFTHNDITESYISWLNDTDVVRFSNQRFKQHSYQTCLRFFEGFDWSNALFIAIWHQESNKMIGTMTVYSSHYHQVADIGIMLGEKPYWGKGFGKDAWQAILNLLQKHSDLRKITGGTLSCNKSMINVMQSAGMTEDGRRKSQELVDGTAHDIVHFAWFRGNDHA